MDVQLCKRKKLLKNEEKKIDRLSRLPEQILCQILSSMETKYAVRTCVLSKRWKRVWTHVHSLDFDNTTFASSSFSKFVSYVLKRRKSFTLCKLRLLCRGIWYPSLSEKLFAYAKRHRFEELETDISCLPSKLLEFQSLTTLKLLHCTFRNRFLDFDVVPTLTTLLLSKVRIFFKDRTYDIFSRCSNLENLSLTDCHVAYDIFKITTPRLVNLTVSCLTGQTRKSSLVISAPKLKFADFRGQYPLRLRIDDCSNDLEKVNVELFSTCFIQGYVSDMVSMVESLSRAKFINASWDYSKVSKNLLVFLY